MLNQACRKEMRGMLFAGLSLLLCLFSIHSFAQQKKLREVEVIKFDNYSGAGEQKVYKQSFPDSAESPVFNLAFAIKQFGFPPANDTLNKILAGKKTPQYKPAQFDSHKRLLHYYRNAKEHYEFEYNTYGNLQYIKRWGLKHVTAQMTFIYVY
jgi:hypothetical protein